MQGSQRWKRLYSFSLVREGPPVEMQDIAGRLAAQQQLANHTYAVDLCN